MIHELELEDMRSWDFHCPVCGKRLLLGDDMDLAKLIKGRCEHMLYLIPYYPDAPEAYIEEDISKKYKALADLDELDTADEDTLHKVCTELGMDVLEIFFHCIGVPMSSTGILLGIELPPKEE